MGNSPKEPAEAGGRLDENVCCPQEGASQRGLGPGGWATVHLPGQGFRRGMCWEEGGAAGLESSLRFSLGASPQPFWVMIPQGLQGGEEVLCTSIPGMRSWAFPSGTKEEPQGWKGGTLRSGSWHSQSPNRARRKPSGLGRGSDPLPPPRTGPGRELKCLLRAGICALSTGMTQHLHTSY